MGSPRCANTESLAAFLDHLDAPAERAAMYEHLVRCDRCLVLAADVLETLEILERDAH